VPPAQIFPLQNSIQKYAWGSTTELPRLLGLPETGEPHAELWMGAHPRGPSRVEIDGKWRTLRDLIEDRPTELLGKDAVQRFGTTLPFLLKVLAVAEPLSLQAHPSPRQAEEGFARENHAGIPIDASHRNYRDSWPKPELICALTPFRALCGFRPWSETHELFDALGLATELSAFASDTGDDSARIEALFREILELSPERRDPLLERATRAARLSAPPDHLAACATLLELYKRYPADAGALTSLMLNCLELQPGEAIYLPAGNLHAYLGGLGVEIMAASDNVLRGGLTQKHVDKAELLSTLVFRGERIQPLAAPAQRARETSYPTEASQFALTRVDFRGAPWRCTPVAGPRILLAARDRIEVAGASVAAIERGHSVFVPANTPEFTLRGMDTMFVASVPPAA
jgi:mannose-6-phosphate isomerase